MQSTFDVVPFFISMALVLISFLMPMFLGACTMHTSQKMMPQGLFAQTQNEQLSNAAATAPMCEELKKAEHLCEKMYAAFHCLKREHDAYLREQRNPVTRAEAEALGFVIQINGKRIENINTKTGEKVTFIEKLGNAMERRSPIEWAHEISRWEDQNFVCIDIQGEESFIYINKRENEPRGWKDFYGIAYRMDEVNSLSSETSIPHSQESASAPALGVIRGMSTLGDIAESAARKGATEGIKAGF